MSPSRRRIGAALDGPHRPARRPRPAQRVLLFALLVLGTAGTALLALLAR